MPKNTLIYNRLISIPETSGTQYYKTQITTDKNFNFLTGILCMLASGSIANKDIEIEIRDDYSALFSFSPAENWIKVARNHSAWDMTKMFRPCNLTSKGKNIYINVKATDCEAFSFVVYLKQTTEAIRCIDYNFQCYDIASNSNNVIALPTNYKYIRGVQVALPDGHDAEYQLRIEDASGNLLDDIMVDAIKVRSMSLYDNCFFPVNFPGDARDVKIFLTRIDETTTTTISAKLCFLVCNTDK